MFAESGYVYKTLLSTPNSVKNQQAFDISVQKAFDLNYSYLATVALNKIKPEQTNAKKPQ